MELQSTLEAHVCQLKNSPHTLEAILSVCRCIMATLYQICCPNAEAHRPGPVSQCPDSDILTLAWVSELAGVDSERGWYGRIKAEYGHLFPHLPSRTRFNRRRRQLCAASEKCRQKLVELLPEAEVFLVDSFPMPLCDKKRAGRSTSALTCSDQTATHAAYGYCATKGLGWFFGFRCSVITTDYGVPVDFAIACANIDDRAVLEALCERHQYPILLGDKGYISESLATQLFERHRTHLFAVRRRNQKVQYNKAFSKWLIRVRRRIETTIGQLASQFSIERIRVRDHLGLRTRVSNKMGGMTLGVFVNVCLGRSLMSLADVIYA